MHVSTATQKQAQQKQWDHKARRLISNQTYQAFALIVIWATLATASGFHPWRCQHALRVINYFKIFDSLEKNREYGTGQLHAHARLTC